MDDDTTRFLLGLACCCGPGLAMSCQGSLLSNTARQAPKTPWEAEEMDGWKMIQKKLPMWSVPLNPQLPLCLSNWESPSVPPFLGWGWSRHLSLKRCSFSAPDLRQGPSEPPGLWEHWCLTLGLCWLVLCCCRQILECLGWTRGCLCCKDYSPHGVIPLHSCVTLLFEQCPTVVPREASTGQK